jgi:16S rRNA (cytidine1402-2'-O)-methyltransferase
VWLETISGIKNTLTFFETPHRIAQTMSAASAILGNRPIVIGRELTKAHQELIRGTAQSLSGRFGQARGEYTVVVGPAADNSDVRETADDRRVVADFCYLTETVGNTRREAINAVAKKHRLPSKTVYQMVERAKTLANNQ